MAGKKEEICPSPSPAKCRSHACLDVSPVLKSSSKKGEPFVQFLDDSFIAFIREGEEIPTPFTPLAELPLVILVGLTGVGKTTILNLLPGQGVDFTVLPNRRRITDDVIITSLQREQGQLPQPVTDRVERFDYTARYRAKYPGGMAFALSRIAVNAEQAADLLLFDGLRGLDEVRHAAAYFPLARFFVLDAPDTVRLSRLLQRGDTFDVANVGSGLSRSDATAALLAVPGVDVVFDTGQIRQITDGASAAGIPVETVVEKLSIIVKERRNYDSAAARDYLSVHLDPNRLLVVDTVRRPAEDVAAQAAEWLRQR